MLCVFKWGLIVVGREALAIEGVVFIICLVGITVDDKAGGQILTTGFFVLVLTLEHDIAEGAEDKGTNEVDEKVLDGISDTNVKVAPLNGVHRAIGGDDIGLSNILDANNGLHSVWVEGDGVDARDEHILLHIDAEEIIEGKFKEFPEHPDGHGEAEGHHGEIEGGEADILAVVIEQLNHREANGSSEEAIDGVEHRIPAGDGHIEMVDLAKNFCGEDEEIDAGLECRWTVNLEAILHQRRDEEEKQGKQAEGGAVVVAVKNSTNHCQNNEHT